MPPKSPKPPKQTSEQKLAAIRALDPSPTAATIAALHAALADTWLVVAGAAAFAREHAIYAVADDLVAAYTRLARAERGDPNCAARVAIVRALDALSRWDDAVFAAAIATRMSPPPGTSEDTAAQLRATAGVLHVAAGREDMLDVLAALLADRAGSVRTAAARGLGDTLRRDAAALVRYKLTVGDADGDVLQALAEALLQLQRDRGPAFLGALIAARADDDADDVRAEVSAIALGAARAADQLPALIAWSNGCDPERRRRVGFLPMALLRDDDANIWLCERIADGHPPDALAAATALATFAVDPAIAAMIRTAAADQRDARCRAAILALLP